MGKIRKLNTVRAVTIEDIRAIEEYSKLTDEELEQILASIQWFSRLTFKLYCEQRLKQQYQRIAA